MLLQQHRLERTTIRARRRRQFYAPLLSRVAQSHVGERPKHVAEPARRRRGPSRPKPAFAAHAMRSTNATVTVNPSPVRRACSGFGATRRRPCTQGEAMSGEQSSGEGFARPRNDRLSPPEDPWTTSERRRFATSRYRGRESDVYVGSGRAAQELTPSSAAGVSGERHHARRGVAPSQGSAR